MKTFSIATPLAKSNCRPIDIIAYTFFAMSASNIDKDTIDQYDQNLTEILRNSPECNQLNEIIGLSADFLTMCNKKQIADEKERTARAKAAAAAANAQQNKSDESEQTDHSDDTDTDESDEDSDNTGCPVDMEDLFFTMIALMMGQRP